MATCSRLRANTIGMCPRKQGLNNMDAVHPFLLFDKQIGRWRGPRRGDSRGRRWSWHSPCRTPPIRYLVRKETSETARVPTTHLHRLQVPAGLK